MEYLLLQCLNLIEHTFPLWPTQIGISFSQPPGPLPTLTVSLRTKDVNVNNIMMFVEAFRLEFSFPGSNRSFIYYCPRRIIFPGYVRRTVEDSVREGLVAWIRGGRQVHTLMVEHVSELDCSRVV